MASLLICPVIFCWSQTIFPITAVSPTLMILRQPADVFLYITKFFPISVYLSLRGTTENLIGVLGTVLFVSDSYSLLR